jgi:hypothetical protein
MRNYSFSEMQKIRKIARFGIRRKEREGKRKRRKEK